MAIRLLCCENKTTSDFFFLRGPIMVIAPHLSESRNLYT